tara:strand:- start:6733 stop:7827 length:1095 start_codon:yes stop_codon:yes gene_type:complete
LKILLLSDANSIHTLRWAESLKKNSLDIILFSLFAPNVKSAAKYKELEIKVISPNLRSKIKNLREPSIGKIKYILSLPLLVKTIRDFHPNIIHAHYASSYGVLAFISRFRPFILSVWGSDIYDFPSRSRLNKFLLKIIIKSANVVCSTSIAMKEIIKKEFSRNDIELVPFGVDTNFFKPDQKEKKNFLVGTIKSIEKHNGISCLLDAAKIIICDMKEEIDFMIVGDGSLKEEMIQKVDELGLNEKISFKGFVQHDKIVDYFNRLSIFIAVSERESFGVSVIEAASCEIPSITSNIGGLIEVNLHNKTGFVVNVDDAKDLAKNILKLYKDEKMRLKFGNFARQRVLNEFNWEKNLQQMINIYKSL